MASFDHWVRPLTADERVWERGVWTPTREHGLQRSKVRCDYGQGQKRCSREALYLTTYDYVTGRAGRVSSCRRRMCLEHAARFARKHGCNCSRSTNQGSAEEFNARSLNDALREGRV